MPCQQHKSNKIAYKVNLPASFKLNTISCFILSRDVEAKAIKFLWKRKHFDQKDWKRKQTLKRLILSEAGSESKKIPKVRKRKRTRKHKTSRAGSESIKNLTVSTSLNVYACTSWVDWAYNTLYLRSVGSSSSLIRCGRGSRSFVVAVLRFTSAKQIV